MNKSRKIAGFVLKWENFKKFYINGNYNFKWNNLMYYFYT